MHLHFLRHLRKRIVACYTVSAYAPYKVLLQFIPAAKGTFTVEMAFRRTGRRIQLNIAAFHGMGFPLSDLTAGGALTAVTVLVGKPFHIPVLDVSLGSGQPGAPAAGAGGGIVTPGGVYHSSLLLTAAEAYLDAARPIDSFFALLPYMSVGAGEDDIHRKTISAAVGIMTPAHMQTAGAFIHSAAVGARLPMGSIAAMPFHISVVDIIDLYARFRADTAGEFISAGGGMRRAFGDITAQIAKLPVLCIVGAPFQTLAVVNNAPLNILSPANGAHSGRFAAVGMGRFDTVAVPGCQCGAAQTARLPVERAVMVIDCFAVMPGFAEIGTVALSAYDAQAAVIAVGRMLHRRIFRAAFRIIRPMIFAVGAVLPFITVANMTEVIVIAFAFAVRFAAESTDTVTRKTMTAGIKHGAAIRAAAGMLQFVN